MKIGAMLLLLTLTFGCGGEAPPNVDNLGATARCADGTITTDCDGCVNNGGVVETFVGCYSSP